jgi:hypothetical protein
MDEEHVNVVQVHGDDTYERIWELVQHGAMVSVEFVRDGDRRMLATTTLLDDHGVTLDRTIVEV